MQLKKVGGPLGPDLTCLEVNQTLGVSIYVQTHFLSGATTWSPQSGRTLGRELAGTRADPRFRLFSSSPALLAAVKKIMGLV